MICFISVASRRAQVACKPSVEDLGKRRGNFRAGWEEKERGHEWFKGGMGRADEGINRKRRIWDTAYANLLAYWRVVLGKLVLTKQKGEEWWHSIKDEKGFKVPRSLQLKYSLCDCTYRTKDRHSERQWQPHKGTNAQMWIRDLSGDLKIFRKRVLNVPHNIENNKFDEAKKKLNLDQQQGRTCVSTIKQ